MAAVFFGEYLIRENIITTDQLETAIKYQHQGNTLIGDLAVQVGFMREEQVHHVLGLQTQSCSRFGQIAMAQGLLSNDQLERLLILQAEKHIYIGEALLHKKILDAEALNRHLNAYEKEAKKHQRVFDVQLQDIPQREILGPIIRISLSYFNRLGVAVKPDALVRDNADLDALALNHFCAMQTINRQPYHFSVALTESLLAYFCRSIIGKPMDEDLFDDVGEYFDQLVFNLNYIICKELKQCGFMAKSGAMVSFPKNPGILAAIRLKTVLNLPVYLILSN